MNDEKQEKKIKRTYLITAMVFLLVLAVYDFFLDGWAENKMLFSPRATDRLSLREIGEISASVDAIVSRLFGSFAAFFTVKYLGFTVYEKCGGKGLLCALPCFLAAILNPPILALIFKNSTLDYSGGKMAAYALMFAAECVCVAAFEETLFRGAVFLTLLENRRNGGTRILASAAVSSAIFAAAHILNFFTAAPGAVLLQIGYSFLLGGMCAYTLICTKNLGYCIALHAIFNFCGTLTEKFGNGSWATVPIIAFTCVLGVVVAAIVLRGFFGMKKEDCDCFFKKREI